MHARRLLAFAAAFALALPAAHAQPLRESTGQRRAALDKMELQPLPADLWGKLGSWTGGEALTAGNTGGKAVLIVGWASWSKPSAGAMSLAQRMADQFGGQGLIVVGVHHPQGWVDAADAAKKAGAKFVLAHDSTGEFRKALKIDHDPEFYLVDRAGHLRYAALASPSVPEACAEIVGETVAQANDLPSILKKRADDEAAKGRRTQEIRPDIDLASLPPVPPGYSTPSESVYRNTAWPKLADKIATDAGLVDQNGQRTDVKLTFQPQGWFPARPEIQGRAMVLYFWHPDMSETFTSVMPKMDLLQKQYRRDLAVVGVMIPRKKLDSSFGNSGQQDDETAEKLVQRYRTFVNSRDFAHALAADPTGSSVNVLGQASNKLPSPAAMVVSSDGIIRWIGSVNSQGFRYAVETIVAEDPGVRARRAADQAFIENKKK